MQHPPDQDLLTVSEVAERLRVDRTTIRRWIRSGMLDAISISWRGKRWASRITRTTFDALLEPWTLKGVDPSSRV